MQRHNPAGRFFGLGRPRLLIMLLVALTSLLLAGLTAPGATRAACTDGDGDGYGSPASGDCTHPQLDCNDGNAAINPGATEVCDGVDNNCNGNIDESFDVGADCNVSKTNSFGTCKTLGKKVCDPNDSSQTTCFVCDFTVMGNVGNCTPVDPATHQNLLKSAEEEGPFYDQSCYDTVDNDCDSPDGIANVDTKDSGCTAPEKCNGLDDDGDGLADNGFALGVPCTVGVGICQKTGVTICDPNDQTQTKCSVNPGGPIVEGPPGSAKCSDGLDDDCDGATDIADAGCQEPEKCDGIDNDGNGQIDETFADLGQACTSGQGACQGNGVKVCSADGTGTICNAVAKLASTEGPSGPTCTDGIDNDCDGAIDGDDFGCNSANIAVTCALPYSKGKPGNDCEGKHVVQFIGTGGGANAVTTAELLGLDADGKVIGSIQGIRNRDEVQMNSRIDPSDWKFQTLSKRRYSVFAPVPMLRVTRTDGANTAVAYCSNIPFLDVVKPSGNVVSQTENNVTKVVAAIPRVDPHTLFVKVDGVDILAALGIDPATQFPGGPFGGVVMIGASNVTISDLRVDVGAINVMSSNTLTMTLEGLGCGGHVIVVDGDHALDVFIKPPTVQCLVDDLRDKGTNSVFGIQISDPTPGLQTTVIPTPVVGKVCGGNPITEALVQGQPQDVSGQMIVPGDGEDSGDTVMLDINTTIPQTNLAGDVANNGSVTGLGTFDPGENRLVVSATDDDGNKAFKDLLFSIGDVTSAGSSASSSSSVASAASASLTPDQQAEIQQTVQDEVQKSIKNKLSSTEIQDAFVLGLKPEAIDTYFQETCIQATADAETKTREALLAKTFPKKEVNGGISCNPDVSFHITSVDFQGDLSCHVTLDNQFLTVNVALPNVLAGVTAYGRCETDACLFGACVCIAETIVDIDATALLKNVAVTFPITEMQIKVGGDSTGTLVPGTAEVNVTRDDSEVNCLAGFIADVLEGFLNFLIFIFTFGQANGIDLTPTFEGVFKEIDLTEKIGLKDFPVKLKGIQPDPGAVADTMKKLQATFDDVKIRPEGLTMILKAVFSNTSTDPEIQGIPQVALTPTPAPMPVQPAAEPSNTYFVAADDALNQLFAAMTQQGEVKTICLPSDNTACTDMGKPAQCCTGPGTGTCTGKTIGDLLPANCGGLVLPKLNGICTGLKQLDCEALALPAAQGACHATRGDNCNTIPLGILQASKDAELDACNNTPFLNLFATTPLLFCGRADVPPNLLIQDNAATPGIETHLRLNDLLVSLVFDRNENHMADGELNALPPCSGDGVDMTADCRGFSGCLDLNFNTTLSLDTTGGKLKIKPEVTSVDFPMDRDPGVACINATPIGDDLQNLLDQAAGSNPIGQVKDNVNAFTPPIQNDGLDLGGVVLFDNPQLFTIENGADPNFQDYVGLRGNIVPMP